MIISLRREETINDSSEFENKYIKLNINKMSKVFALIFLLSIDIIHKLLQLHQQSSLQNNILQFHNPYNLPGYNYELLLTIQKLM